MPAYSPSLNLNEQLKSITPELHFAGQEFAPWRRRVRSAVRKLSGLVKNHHEPLHAKMLWARDHELGRIEKVRFRAEPGAEVPAYVCLPRNATPPYRWVICVQGHSTGMHNSIAVARDDEAQSIEVEGDRDFGLIAMRHGFAAFCIEQRSFGEREEAVQAHLCGRMCQEAAMHALLVGRTLIGERVFDVDRGIDYLYTRPDVNRKCIGVMGNSGGGTTSLFAAALLPRLAFSMPSCYFNTFKDSLLSIAHCECNYIPGLYAVAEMSDILGTFAPKPVVVVAGKQDDIFPIKATRKAFRELKAIYTAAGAPKNCKLVEGEGGHRFYADSAWRALLQLVG